MIHRQNYLDTRVYLQHSARVRQNSPATVKRTRALLRHLLEWADDIPLPHARSIDPTLPRYLTTARADGRDDIAIAPATLRKCLGAARQFFVFARAEWPARYKPISESWIHLLQPPREARESATLPVREFWTLDDVGRIASVSAATLRQQRGQVAACMLFLSGMRADALASLPIAGVDLRARQIAQLPATGVRTKNRQAAITHLLEIPELLQVVQTWDRQVRAQLPSHALWYATLTRDGMRLTLTSQAFEGRNKLVADDLRLICEIAGVKYLSPHKMRHGHVVYALKRAQNMAELKAISQNVMHASVVITDQIYGKLANDDVGAIISRLGQGETSPGLEQKLDELLVLLRDHR